VAASIPGAFQGIDLFDEGVEATGKVPPPQLVHELLCSFDISDLGEGVVVLHIRNARAR